MSLEDRFYCAVLWKEACITTTVIDLILKITLSELIPFSK